MLIDQPPGRFDRSGDCGVGLRPGWVEWRIIRPRGLLVQLSPEDRRDPVGLRGDDREELQESLLIGIHQKVGQQPRISAGILDEATGGQLALGL